MVEEVSGAAMLDELRAAVLAYVRLSSAEAADAVVLWIAASHAQPAWEHAPRLVITAPEKRCGKSRLLDLVEAAVHEPLITVNASVAAVVRSIGVDPPTLLVDEADTIFGPKAKGDNEDLRGILNAGHQRNRPSIRFNVTLNKVEKLNTFGMAALAGIGDMPDTIMDRAVVVRMRRQAPGDRAKPYRTRRDRPVFVRLAARLHTWVREQIEVLGKAEPDMPVEDRDADTWEPLVTVADLAGGHWPARARHAAVVLTEQAKEADTEASLSLRLLADLRQVFTDQAADRLPTKVILARLCALDEAPWSDLYGKALDARRLGRELGKYGISSKSVRVGDGSTPKGYDRADLADAWTRYLPPDPSATTATHATPLVNPVADSLDTSATLPPQLDLVADTAATAQPSAAPVTSTVAPVADVADTPPETDHPAPPSNQEAPCRDCRKSTKDFILASRDGRCITCNQHHRNNRKHAS